MTDNRLPIPSLTPLVLLALRVQARTLGLEADRVSVEYVLNWGGFGSASFNTTDGRRRIHLKLTPETNGQQALRRWQGLRSILEERYHAPRMLGWLTVPGTAYQGPIFEFIEGEYLDGVRMPGVLEELLRVIGRLHADQELIRKLAPNTPPRTYLDCLVSRYADMLREDLEMIRAEPPPFITPARLRWMAEQVDLLEQLARDSGAFGGTARSVVHWDLWWNNILVGPAEQWHLLDWDDVGLGDPAMDFSNVLFPLTCEPVAVRWQTFPIPDGDEMFSVRMAIYRRAQVLDFIIDVLADWIECRAAPSVQAQVHARKRADHERYLRIYEADYGISGGVKS